MGKKKSAACLILITLLILGFFVWCIIPTFSIGIKEYHSVIDVIKKDVALGGGYTATYYPEGVISEEEYNTSITGYGSDTEKRDEFIAKYQKHGTGAIYLEKETVLDSEGKVDEAFSEAFEANVSALSSRFEKSHIDGARVEVADDYTIRVTLPDYLSNAGTYAQIFAYTGEATVAFGDTDTVIMQATKKVSMKDYIKGAWSRTVQGTSYVVIDFTEEGRALLKEKTADTSSSKTLYFMVGDQSLIPLSISEQLDQESLAISGSYTEETAQAVAIVFDNAINGAETSLKMEMGDLQPFESNYGEFTIWFAYIGLGVLMLASIVFFFVKYHRLGFAHLYGLLAYFDCMALCIAFIDFVHLGLGGIAAIALNVIVYSVSNYICFERAKSLRETKKNMTASIKTGYKNSLSVVLDTHIVLAAIGFITFAIALTELRVAAFIFGMGTLLSAACTMLVTRFCWAIMMPFAKSKDKFCNFRLKEGDNV